jgi:hemoglobin
VVDLFYQKVLADPSLVGFFTGIDMDALRRHQTLLVSQVMGGPAQYAGRTLQAVHSGLSVSDGDFDRVVEHLVAALQEAGVTDDVIGRVGEALAGTRPDVVTAGSAPE